MPTLSQNRDKGGAPGHERKESPLEAGFFSFSILSSE